MKDFLKKLKKEYQETFQYIKSAKRYIYFIIGIFLLFSLIGFFAPVSSEIANQILDYFKNLVEKTKGYSGMQMIWFLLGNNSMATFIGLFSGVFFGLFSGVNAALNGFVLGFAASVSSAENGLLVLFRLIPHGIFELPAIFISLGLGVKLGTFIFQKSPGKSLKEYLRNSARAYLLVVLPLLVVAAIIEGLLIVLNF